ncbi:cyclic nucleotide-gated ion channel 17-like [Ananas comosus]|uniref:Cyclic nucleotide-gated ion channel 17-like n=2 Tax=Ananas comosus TaxID=4615 RepID=A0A199UXQ0_ANACO|nr:cyclic nucleotide-gated ion channel 17-like [Ananas comosus]OAY69391.1 putative cyclic nucleotide-gated ion channel 17 [Ananas comosus]
MFGSRRVDDMVELKRQRTVRFYSDEKRNLPTHNVPKQRFGDANNKKSKLLAKDDEPWRKGVLNPGSDFVLHWNRVFLISCLIAVFIDPMYFYLPSIDYGNHTSCIKTDRHLTVVVTVFRSLADFLYVLHIVFKFRTAYVAPDTRVFGRGELVMDPKRIAWRYLTSDFVIDLVAALPLPQIVIWLVIPAAGNSSPEHNNNTLAMIVLIQYIPRLYLIFPSSYEIIKATGVVAKTAWVGAAYNLLLYLIASHVLGALWYLLSVDRQTTCWKQVCMQEDVTTNIPFCRVKYLDCDFSSQEKQIWANSTNVFTNCDATNSSISFNFGMFQPALSNHVPAQQFVKKYFYSFWWGLQNLSCYGQILTVSTFIGETLFAIFLAVLGLVLFAHLIGNVETYLQSITVRVEEWRLKQRDTEEWMKHRRLPHDLRERVRRFIQYKWLATRGVDEESMFKCLPADLRRDIKRHLCLDIVRRVSFFSEMDAQLLDAICERLVSSLCTEGTYIVREGDPVTEMLFIVRGKLESSTTNGGRTGFFNSITLKPGDFCGEELLGWALLPRSVANLPCSTRTVKALVEVEAFALRAEDLKFVANQFRRLHSKKLQHALRFYSPHWRSWAACFIQVAWRRFMRRKGAKELSLRESSFYSRSEEESGSTVVSSSKCKQSIGVIILASNFATNLRKGARRIKDIDMPKLQKPDEPDFSVEPFD